MWRDYTPASDWNCEIETKGYYSSCTYQVIDCSDGMIKGFSVL